MKSVEKWLWLVGAMLLALYFGGQAWGETLRQRALANFAELKLQQAAQPIAKWAPQSLLAPGIEPAMRVDAGPTLRRPMVAASPAHGFNDLPIAVLRIPRLLLEVPVGFGTDESVLLRGAGWIEGTATPGTLGNVAIAAHRDSFFRGLKDVAVGDLIEIETLDRSDSYRVAELSIVAPTDVGVLADTGNAALTLVTCYPFYFVGHAPQRFIVRAVAADFRS